MSDHSVEIDAPCRPKTGWLTGETYCAVHGRAAGWPCRHTVENDAGHLWRAVGPNAGDLWNQCARCGADEGSIRGRTPCPARPIPPVKPCGCGHPHADHDDAGACMHLCDCAWPIPPEVCCHCGQRIERRDDDDGFVWVGPVGNHRCPGEERLHNPDRTVENDAPTYRCAECGGAITTRDNLVTVNVEGRAKAAHRTCPIPPRRDRSCLT